MPVNVAEELEHLLFAEVRSVILTSATLTVGEENPFGYLRGRLGLRHCQELKLGSPFDYRRQVKLYLVRDMPDPNDEGAFVARLTERLKHYIMLTRAGLRPLHQLPDDAACLPGTGGLPDE